MHTTTRRTRRGLDASAPERGIGRDAYEVALTAAMLTRRCGGTSEAEWYGAPARHAVTLHRLSGLLDRYAERLCDEDLTCPACGGDGRVSRTFKSREHGGKRLPLLGEHNRETCPACAGHGNTLGRRIERARQDARDIATHYGLRAYFQTDPRGCALYLIDPASVPDVERLGEYVYACDGPNPDPTETKMREKLRARWIHANYNRGHAVVRLGR